MVEFLDRFATGDDMARVDRICRSPHLANFVRATPADGYLFLNLHPRHLLSTRRHGEVFSHIADAAGVPPQRIVMEILEHKTSDEAQLADAVKALKARGFLIALDDFGQEGHSVHYDRLTAPAKHRQIRPQPDCRRQRGAPLSVWPAGQRRASRWAPPWWPKAWKPKTKRRSPAMPAWTCCKAI